MRSRKPSRVGTKSAIDRLGNDLPMRDCDLRRCDNLDFAEGSGLGTFEASAIWTIQMAGASLPAAASVTLLFRGLSFWLPMLPGAWCSRDSAPLGKTDGGKSTSCGTRCTQLGGASNLARIDACTTRGVVRPSADTLQLVVGPIADQLASEIREAVRSTLVSKSHS
jgi:hypothetical protein